MYLGDVYKQIVDAAAFSSSILFIGIILLFLFLKLFEKINR